MTVTYYVTVKSGDHVQSHKVDGEGESLLQCYTSVITQIAESFPSDKGHLIVGVKSNGTGGIRL